MHILADTHVHFYPNYDFKKWVDSAFKNFTSLEKDLSREESFNLLFLTERYDCDFFNQLSAGKFNKSEFNIENISSKIIKISKNNSSIYIISGRQVISAEKIEVLVLGFEGYIADGSPVHDIIKDYNKDSLQLIIPWSPGKWLFSRGKIIENLIDSKNQSVLAFSDVISRPRFFPKPRLIKKAQNLGYKIFAGSDPLPLDGEEKYPASYVSHFKLTNFSHDVTKVIDEIFKTQPEKTIGKRLCFPTIFMRLYRLRACRVKLSKVVN